jgi:Uma2 family endonuclease
LLCDGDDGIVVVMERLTTNEYFLLSESMRPMELVYGYVREPPAPRYGHQSIVTRLTVLLDGHVRARGLGQVCVSPVDVGLDGGAALVVQPDIIFISRERAHIVRDRIWGAPDLVVEVLSERTARRDRTTKVGWYARYGVKECWLVAPRGHRIEVFAPGAVGARQSYSGALIAKSTVLPDWDVPTSHLFE